VPASGPPEPSPNTQAAPHIGALSFCILGFQNWRFEAERQKFSELQYSIVSTILSGFTEEYNANKSQTVKIIAF
jgi:hypothetical protein